MTSKVNITLAASAVRDLEAIQAYYEDQGVPEVGARIVIELLKQVELLEDHPMLGRVVPEFDNKSTRELLQKPFRIVYRYSPGRVQIIRIWRSERQLRLP